MCRFATLASLILGLLALPASAPGQAAKTAKVDPAALRAKLLQGQYVEGKMTAVDAAGDDKKLTLVYSYLVKAPKAAEYKKYAAAVAQFNFALEKRSTSLEDIKKIQAEVKKAQDAAFDVDETRVPFEISATAKTPVRTLFVPTNPDGTAKKLSAQEAAKLKGPNPNLPGNLAQFTDLKDKTVRVTIDKTKLKPGVKPDETSVYPATMLIIVPTPLDPIDDLKPIVLK